MMAEELTPFRVALIIQETSIDYEQEIFDVEQAEKEIQQVLNQTTSKLRAENERLKANCRELQWMAKRYAEGRQTFAPSTVNEITRQLMAMGVELNLCAEKTPWARDGGGRKYSTLTDDEWNQGEPPDKWFQIAYDDDFKALQAESAQKDGALLALRSALQNKCDIDYYASDAIAETRTWEELKEYCRLHNEALEALGSTSQKAKEAQEQIWNDAIDACSSVIFGLITAEKGPHALSDAYIAVGKLKKGGAEIVSSS